MSEETTMSTTAPNTPPRRRNLPRTVVAVSLATSGLLSLASNLSAPDFPADAEDRIRAIAEGGALAVTSGLTFAFAQLFLLVGVLGAGALAWHRRPVLASVATSLVVLGAFGHSVFAGVNMVMLQMAQDLGHVDVHADLLADLEGGPTVIFMAMGLIGTVLGLVLLAVALWRSRAVPGWIPAAMAGFVLLEFGGGAISEWSFYAAGVLYVCALGGLALAVHRSDLRVEGQVTAEEHALVSP